MDAIRIIKDEHRSLAAVLHGMLYIVRDVRERGRQPDFNLLGAMVYYIDVVPERYHHPKEDKYLFWFLRLRHPESAELLDRLQAEHRTGVTHIRDLEQTLLRYQQGGQEAFEAFAAAVEAYATFEWAHMRAEESEVLPLAEKHLQPPDWVAVDDAFKGHTDPLLGVEAGTEYHNLFRRILHLAPPPIGVGPER